MFLFSGFAMYGVALFLNTGQEQGPVLLCPAIALVAPQTFLKPFLPPPLNDFGAFVSARKLAFLSARPGPRAPSAWSNYESSIGTVAPIPPHWIQPTSDQNYPWAVLGGKSL